MPIITDIGSLIVRSDDIRGGRLRIAGTGVTVRRIVGWYRRGLTPEEITTEVPHLSLAQVYAALTYYHANREETEADIATAVLAALPSYDHAECVSLRSCSQLTKNVSAAMTSAATSQSITDRM